MEFIESIFLGLLQGLTEWLPVSSTGHLVLALEALGLAPEEYVLFLLILHAATLLSVSVFLRRELKEILLSLFVARSELDAEGLRARRMGQYAILATIPAAAAGIIMGDYLDEIFSAQPVAFALLITGAMLWVAESPRFRRGKENLTLIDSLIIGIFQASSMIPGISRSGSTISSGCYLGLGRELVAIFSFLLSIPLILASIVYGIFFLEAFEIDWTMILAAAIVAFVSGLLALKLLFSMIKRFRLKIFAIYCWCLGIVVILLLL